MNIRFTDFGFRKYSPKTTFIGYVYSQDIDEIERFLFYFRAANSCLQAYKKTNIQTLLGQLEELNLNEEEMKVWDNYIHLTFDETEQEKFISKLLIIRIVNCYLTYVKDLAEHILNSQKNIFLEKNISLRNWPEIKKCYKSQFTVPLHETFEEEKLADQYIIVRNLLVHGIGGVPDEIIPKLPDWKELECIKLVDEEILLIDPNIESVERFGSFFSRAAAGIDNRVTSKFDLISMYFSKDDIPEEYRNGMDTGFEDIIDEDM